MKSNLNELNETINSVVNYIVAYSTQHTSSGNYYIGYDDVSHLISKDDFTKYFDLIAGELATREEILDLEVENYEFNANYGLAYCPNYEWCPGNEAIFDMTEEEWKTSFRCKPVSQPLSISRLADIGKNAIPFVLSELDDGVDVLSDIFGMSDSELHQIGLPIAELIEEHQNSGPAKHTLDHLIQSAQQRVDLKPVSGHRCDLEHDSVEL